MNIRKNVAVSDSGLVFNPESGESFSVNAIGLEIFRMIRNGNTAQEIIGEIISKYNTDKSIADKDLQDFITILGNYNLLEDDGEK